MDEDITTTLDAGSLFGDPAWFDPIEAGLRERIRGFIEELIEQELAAALGQTRYQRAEQPKGWRNGKRKRHLLGSFGPVTVSIPRARLVGADGGTREWRSAALPHYARMTRQAEALITATYLAGTNTRRVRRALCSKAPSART
jgi:transposase-like protein